MRRVVVTGLGLVTPLGGDVETTWKNIIAAKSGAGTITRSAISSARPELPASKRRLRPSGNRARMQLPRPTEMAATCV